MTTDELRRLIDNAHYYQSIYKPPTFWYIKKASK